MRSAPLALVALATCAALYEVLGEVTEAGQAMLDAACDGDTISAGSRLDKALAKARSLLSPTPNGETP